MPETIDYIPYIIFIVLFYVGATSLFLIELRTLLVVNNYNSNCIKIALCIGFTIPITVFFGLYYYNQDLFIAATLIYSFLAFVVGFCLMGYTQYSKQRTRYLRVDYEEL
jgi:hypothetical protein